MLKIYSSVQRTRGQYHMMTGMNYVCPTGKVECHYSIEIYPFTLSTWYSLLHHINISLRLLHVQVLMCLFKQNKKSALHIHFKHSKIILRNTSLEWEPICSIYLQLSSRHCRSLPLCHQPRQQLATSRCLTHRTCVAVRPDCHVIEKIQGNSHCLGPLQTYVNGVYISLDKTLTNW